MNVSKGFYLLLVAVSSLLTLALVWPFAQYVLLAVLLAYVLYPLQKRLEPRLGATLSSLSLVVGATLSIIVPFVVMIGVIAADAVRFAQGLQNGGPRIVGRADVNPSIIIVGVIGGMYFMGFMGLFFGPVIVGAFKVVLETFHEHYDDLEPAGEW